MKNPIQKIFSLRKMKTIWTGICGAWRKSCQVKIAFGARGAFFCLVITEDPKERRSPPSHYPLTLSHSRHSSLPVSALGLGSLSRSGLSGKLLHQTRVSSPGCHLTVRFSRAALQHFKRLGRPLWRALMKSVAWASLLLILLVRSHTWLSKGKLNHR